MINLSIRNYQITIGGLECTPALISFQGSDSKLDESGLITFTGTIVLGRPDGFESLDDRRNNRWSRGTAIDIRIADKVGTLRPAPRCSKLHILSALFDLKSRKLTLQVGDVFALLNFKQGKGDKSGICLGTQTSKNDVVLRLLTAAGIGQLNGFVPGTLSAPAPRLLEGNYIQQAGAITASEGRVLFVENGIPTVGALSPASTVLVTITAETGLVEYSRLEGEQAPTQVKVRARVVVVRKTDDTTETLSEERDPALLVGLNSTAEILIRRTRTLERFDRASKIRTIETWIDQPRGMIDPANEKFRGKTDLMPAEYQIEQYFYEANSPIKDGESRCEKGNQGRLMLRRVDLWKPNAIVFKPIFESYPKDAIPGTKKPAFPANLDYLPGDYRLILSQRTETRYQYDFGPGATVQIGGAIDNEDKPQELEKLGAGLKISTLTYQTVGALLPEDFMYSPGSKFTLLESYADLAPVERQTTMYREPRFGEWHKEEVTEKANAIAYPDTKDTVREQLQKESLVYRPSRMLGLVPADGIKRTVSNVGQAQPPAPDTYNPAYSSQETTVVGKAVLPVDAATQYRQKEREISFEYLSAVGESPGAAIAQARTMANQLAQWWGVIYWGRYKGSSVITDLADGWFNYRPLARINVTEPDGIAAYQADGFSLAMSEKRCVVGFDGILLGWTSIQQPNMITPIYRTAREVEAASGSAVTLGKRFYSLEPIRKTITVASASAIAGNGTILKVAGGSIGRLRPNFVRLKTAGASAVDVQRSRTWEETSFNRWKAMTPAQWRRIG